VTVDERLPVESAISIRDVSFGYSSSVPILENISLDVKVGEILVLIGPSGCGKSTMLNLIAGSVTPTAGSISTFGQQANGLNNRVAYMTQRDTLLPWRSALDNAALPLEIAGVPRKERHMRAREQMARMGVLDAERRRPHQLSGGMRSRLSLAQAFLCGADIFLMDEPFAAIDALRRVRLQKLLFEFWRETNKTILYVTHDLNEALALGHRILVMRANPGGVLMERTTSDPRDRDVLHYRNTPEAQKLYAELWDALEAQFDD
jgi:NitT/TauT family transport system ATP-binding protein